MKKHALLAIATMFCLTSCTDDIVVLLDENAPCTQGDLHCYGEVLQVCDSGIWVKQEKCAYGCDSKLLKCASNSEVPKPEKCNAGEVSCSDGTLTKCVNGKPRITPCVYGCNDAGDGCVIPETCNDNDVFCDNDERKICHHNEWDMTEHCENGCADKENCAANCVNGEAICEDDILQTCVNDDWKIKGCAYGCAASGTECADCATSKCQDDQKTACIGGKWAAETETCPNGCNEYGSDCALAPGCTDGAKLCTGNELNECSGNEWKKIKDCPAGCNEAQDDCKEKVCDENALRCEGNQLQICSNNAWGKKEDCANGCDSAAKKCTEVNNNVPTRYITGPGKLNTPITPYVVQQMKNIMAKNPSGQNNDVIMKVGDSHYDAAIGEGTLNYGFMRCFSNNTTNLPVTLDGRNELQAAIDEFQKTKDSFIRDSLAAVGGESTRQCLSGSPNNLQKEMNQMKPRFAVFGHGSNDLGNGSFTYTKNTSAGVNGYAWAMQDYYRQMNKALNQMIGEGIIPLIQGVAPNMSTPKNINYVGGGAIDKRDYPRYAVPLFDAVSRGVAEARQLPWFDTYNGLYNLPGHGVSDGNVHESMNGSPCNFTSAGLQYGANVRNLGLIQALSDSWRTVIKGEPAPDAVEEPFKGNGSKDAPFEVTSLPFTHSADMKNSPNKAFGSYSCSDAKEPGAEYYYKMVLSEKKRLKMFVVSASGVDQDIHVLKGSIDANQCVARSDILLMGTLDAGTYYISIDTYDTAGEYVMGVIECLSDDERCNDPIKAF